MMTILFFGDSITWGAWDEEGGWVARIKKFVDKKVISSKFKYYHDIYNMGISGDKTSDLLKRFRLETSRRVDEGEKLAIVFSIGVNDSQSLGSGYATSPEQFRSNLLSLIEQARKFTNKIVFIGLFPIDESKLSEEDRVYKLENVSRFNDIIKKVSKEQGVDFLDLYDELVNKNYKDLSIDGLHPNTEGHRFIFEVVLKFLQEKEYI